MSYLDVPRLHFSGTFRANPSTINNIPANYNPKITNPIELWNPDGAHQWQFKNCAVKSVVYSDGTVSETSGSDPIINAAVQSTNQPYTAKLVDLDPDQQMVSEIWGLQIKVAVSDTDYFVGNFGVVPFNDLWFRVQGGQPDSVFSAYYQSVLEQVTWGATSGSSFLQQLQGVSPGALSIKFIVDGYDDQATDPSTNQPNPDFTYGRVVGTIGPAFADEPPNFVAGRFLRPVDFDENNSVTGTPLYFAPARVDTARGKVYFDLGNSIPTTSPAGQPPALGTLQAAILSSGAPALLGEINYSQTDYETTAGVQEFDVTKDQIAQLVDTPLGVVQVDSSGNQKVLLQENSTGVYLNATRYVYRMNPGDVEAVTLIARRFDAPAAHQTIALQIQTFDGKPVGSPPPLVIPASVTTGADGRASFTISASDPGNPRKFIDGQVYAVTFSWDADETPDPNEMLSVHVYDSYNAPPTWTSIQPILQQYAKLYPAMVSILNIGDYDTIKANIPALQMVLNLPFSNPGLMPVTRDLSRDKRQLLITWLNLGAPK